MRTPQLSPRSLIPLLIAVGLLCQGIGQIRTATADDDPEILTSAIPPNPAAFAEATRVWPTAPQVPRDARLAPPRRASQGNDFRPATDAQHWAQRRDELREQALVANGLWPLPQRCELNAKVTSVVDRGDYVVENLYFQSYPGFYVTASLFRPKGKGPYPAVLSAHGHAKHGRHAPPTTLVVDGESTPNAPFQARGIELARLGCIALLYDMCGYADSQQVRHPRDARETRFPEGTDDFEGLAFEQYCLSTMGLQTWNSIRALDYLVSRSDVDPKRIAISGGSGGATQTLMLMMTDDRLAAAAPVCMVSPGFQGDCICEQAALVKIDSDTVEYCAAFAPKPLIVVGATGDWTKEILERGGPEIRQMYQFAGAPDQVEIVRYEAPHNYNKASREAVHNWFNTHLQLGHQGPIVEPPYEPLAPELLAVFSEESPRPDDALTAGQLKEQLIESAEEMMARLRPETPEILAEFRRVVGTGLRHMIASELPSAEQVEAESLGAIERGSVRIERYLLSRRGRGQQVPALLWTPANATGEAALLVHAQGKQALVSPDGMPGEVLAELLKRGVSVLAIDPFLTGEYHLPDQATEPPDPETGMFACFNRTLLANRVYDILTAIAWLRDQPQFAKTRSQGIALVGLEEAGRWTLLAGALAGEAVSRMVADQAAYSFRTVRNVRDPMYLPGALRYGDLPALAALAAGYGKLMVVAPHSWDSSWLRAANAAAARNPVNNPARPKPALQFVPELPETVELVDWLTQPTQTAQHSPEEKFLLGEPAETGTALDDFERATTVNQLLPSDTREPIPVDVPVPLPFDAPPRD